MTVINRRECDCCGEAIGKNTYVHIYESIFAPVHAAIYRWGITDTAPVDSGWCKGGVDLCKDCWTDVLDEVKDRVE